MKIILALAATCLLAPCLGSTPLAQIPFELTGDHAFVEVEINGIALSFVFDSGAGGVAIDPRTAQSLGLEASGSGPVFGAAGTTRVPLVTGLALGLGDLRLERVGGGIIPLHHLAEVLGRPLAGIIGRDVLRGRLVLLDHDRQVIEIHRRESFAFEEWGEPCTLQNTSPIEIRAEVQLLSGEAVAGRFHVDTGAGGFLDLNSDFVRIHALAGRVGETYALKGFGLTAEQPVAEVGRVAGVKFCGHVFPAATPGQARAAVPARLSIATAGVLARSGFGGLIGNGVLKRFNIVFDLEHSRMYLRPNRLWDEPIRTDASGLHFIRRSDGTVEIRNVVDKSPGAVAGLRSGDELRSIDGTSAAEITLAALRDRLKAPRRKFSLVVWRQGETLTVVLDSRAFTGRGDIRG